MGTGAVRSGAPTRGTTVANGTDGDPTDPRIIIFDPPVRPCIVTWHEDVGELLIKINTEMNGMVSETFEQTNGRGHFILPPKRFCDHPTLSGSQPSYLPGHLDVSLGGQVAIHSVSFYSEYLGDLLDNVSVVGFSP